MEGERGCWGNSQQKKWISGRQKGLSSPSPSVCSVRHGSLAHITTTSPAQTDNFVRPRLQPRLVFSSLRSAWWCVSGGWTGGDATNEWMDGKDLGWARSVVNPPTSRLAFGVAVPFVFLFSRRCVFEFSSAQLLLLCGGWSRSAFPRSGLRSWVLPSSCLAVVATLPWLTGWEGTLRCV